MVALAKASAVAAAIIAGFAAGFDFYLAGSLTASVPREDALTAVITFVAAVLLGCAALYLENSCRVPEDPDAPEATALADAAAPARPRLVTRPLLVRFVSVIGTATSFYLLLSAVPLYARSAGRAPAWPHHHRADPVQRAAYPVTPRLMARYGCRVVLAGALLVPRWPWPGHGPGRSD